MTRKLRQGDNAVQGARACVYLVVCRVACSCPCLLLSHCVICKRIAWYLRKRTSIRDRPWYRLMNGTKQSWPMGHGLDHGGSHHHKSVLLVLFLFDQCVQLHVLCLDIVAVYWAITMFELGRERLWPRHGVKQAFQHLALRRHFVNTTN